MQDRTFSQSPIPLVRTAARLELTYLVRELPSWNCVTSTSLFGPVRGRATVSMRHDDRAIMSDILNLDTLGPRQSHSAKRRERVKSAPLPLYFS